MAVDWSQFEIEGHDGGMPSPQPFDASMFELEGQQGPSQAEIHDKALSNLDESFMGRFKNNIVSAANAAFPFADEGAAAVRAYAPTWLGGNSTGANYDQELAAIRQGEQDYATVHPYQSGASALTGIASTAPLLPSGVAGRATLAGRAGQAAVEGAAYGGVQGFGAGEGGLEQRLQDAEQGAIVGGIASPVIVGGLGAAAKGLGSLAEKVRPPTQAEEAVANLKLTGGDFSRASKWKGQGAMGDALTIAEKGGVFSEDVAPEIVAKRNEALIGSLSDDVSNLLKEADAAQGDVQPLIKQVLTPGNLPEVEKVIAKEYYNKDALREQLQRRIQSINENWDGTPSGLNEAKRGLGGAWKQGDSGELDRALYSDLKSAIEGQADSLIPAKAGDVRAKNSDISKLLELQKAAKRAANNAQAAETRAAKPYGWTSLPSVVGGGYAVNLLTGSPVGLAAALGAGATKAILNSKVGASAAASTLGLGSSAASGLSKLGDPRLLRLVEALGGRETPFQGQTPQGSPVRVQQPGQGYKNTMSGTREQSLTGTQTPASAEYPYNTSPISYEPTPSESPEQAPGSYQDIVERLVPAIIQAESSGVNGLTSKKGAQGLMQIMPAMQKRLGVTDPFNERQNVSAGKRLLAEELARFQDIPLAVAAYNYGSPRLKKAMARAEDLDGDGRISFEEVDPYLPRETRLYVRKIAKALAA